MLTFQSIMPNAIYRYIDTEIKIKGGSQNGDLAIAFSRATVGPTTVWLLFSG